ncbi:hypothetical protein EJ07DRAFT_166385 [Lizonia empirigonia]|nr:hypothetical protein EJ07DRAFT_166385 [Lizonia empirigonia]
MAIHFFQQTAAIAVILSAAIDQTTPSIPPDLSAGFTSKEVQVSFSAQAVDGFASGTTFAKDAVANEPTFALGDSNGISPSTRYMLIMVDTTCPDARTLHYARSNFQFSFAGGTNMRPTRLRCSSIRRPYVFLVYTNPQRREITALRLPAAGAAFDAQTFQRDNGLQDPVAGVGMLVQLGGTASCGGQDESQVSSTASSSPASSARLQTSSPSGTSATPSSSTPATPPDSPTAQTTTSLPSSPAAPQSEEPDATTAAPIATPSTTPPSTTPSPTTSGALLEQTANAAARALAGCGALVMRVGVLAGLLAWW